MARVVLVRSARSQILKLDPAIRDGVEDALGLLERDPEAGRPLRGRLSDLLSLHVGSYRVIYELLDRARTVRVLAVRHRSSAYGRDPR